MLVCCGPKLILLNPVAFVLVYVTQNVLCAWQKTEHRSIYCVFIHWCYHAQQSESHLGLPLWPNFEPEKPWITQNTWVDIKRLKKQKQFGACFTPIVANGSLIEIFVWSPELEDYFQEMPAGEIRNDAEKKKHLELHFCLSSSGWQKLAGKMSSRTKTTSSILTFTSILYCTLLY